MKKFCIPVNVFIETPNDSNSDDATRLANQVLTEGRSRVLGVFNDTGLSLRTEIKPAQMLVPPLEEMDDDYLRDILLHSGFPNDPQCIKAGYRDCGMGDDAFFSIMDRALEGMDLVQYTLFSHWDRGDRHKRRTPEYAIVYKPTLTPVKTGIVGDTIKDMTQVLMEVVRFELQRGGAENANKGAVQSAE